ncbi:MAG TPA: DNA polymerase II, partial [Candidatus Polarisedimenticolaceae bacterium]|nr:DNA polymerase II [Candidatus Polarisedimenticolaceae bacterium]
LRFSDRILIERGIRGSLAIDGPARVAAANELVFDDPRIAPADWTPRLSVLSLDIETDPTASRLLSVALEGCGISDVLLLTPPGYDCPAGAHPCADERELLAETAARVRRADPDVITGWNVVDFDLTVLARRAASVGIELRLGRHDGMTRVRAGRAGGPAAARAWISGRVVLDGIALTRGAFIRLDSYSLDNVARDILGKRKTLGGENRATEILRRFEADRPALVDYNRHDARLVLEVLDRLGLVELAVERSLLTGLTPDRVAGSIAAFDFLYLSELHRRRIVAPTVGGATARPIEASGGHVLDPQPGLYRNVIVLDFNSLYPSVIRTFQIDPLGYVARPAAGDDLIVAPNGAAFRREHGVLPALLDQLMPRRERAKARGDRVTSQAIKILMNSFYGVLGTSACRFASAALANAVTGFGRELLLWAKACVERDGQRVIYGDTDSLFVLAGTDDAARARAIADRLAERINGELARFVADNYRVDSRLRIEFERLYLRMLLPRLRGRTSGARKRYVGLVDGAAPTVVFTGMEVVRSDWTALARSVQRELYERLFGDRPVDAYLRETVAQLRAGAHDGELVYRKRLRRPLDSYVSSTPPHVAAARQLARAPRHRVSYVMTVSGPEPIERHRSPIDHEHYVQKQLRPVAEPVLDLLGLDFDRVVGDPRQLPLF